MKVASRVVRKGKGSGALAALVVFAAGCVYVDVDEEAQVVGVAKTREEVADCERKGRVSASTTAKVGFVSRGEESVALELERLARNDAATLGANVIVPLGPVDAEGKRAYDAYLCPE